MHLIAACVVAEISVRDGTGCAENDVPDGFFILPMQNGINLGEISFSMQMVLPGAMRFLAGLFNPLADRIIMSETRWAGRPVVPPDSLGQQSSEGGTNYRNTAKHIHRPRKNNAGSDRVDGAESGFRTTPGAIGSRS
ncbi:hypothetical protein [Thalassovita gelatinovora]|uniref:hypothetical protein n=1 Tax=Thalassovita gelatinovora TaxID=53501 RepID=UPI001442DD9F|nr:hypothetical protein [Thalassovita gelatinovora]QIZ78972.1 hypothetical protein HFZ77_14975 [Thalassovita gelatinovora]